MKKKYVACSILLVLAMAMTACSAKEDKVNADVQQKSEETLDTEDTSESMELVADPTVPEEVKNYKAPTEIGDNFFDYNFKLEGNMYTLPCPVSEFVKNGFEIDEEKSDMVIAGGDFGSLDMYYNGQHYSCLAYNTAEYATIIENCWVGTVTANSSYSAFDLEIVKGIKVGMTGDELQSKLTGVDYTIEDEEYYVIENPSNPYDRGYEIAVYDNVIARIVIDMFIQ